MGALLPPRVISTMMTLRGKVTFLFLTHQRLNRSFVTAAPTLISVLPGFLGSPFTISMLSNWLAFSSGKGREVVLGRCVAVLRSRSEMMIWPLLPKIGDHECPRLH